MPATTIVRGRSWSFDAVIYDEWYGEGDPANVVTNHTGWTIRSQIRTKVGNKLVANLDVTFPVPTAGTVAIRHDRTFTGSLKVQDCLWDIVATNPAGEDIVYLDPEPIVIRDHPTDPASPEFDFVPGGGGAVYHTHPISQVVGLQDALDAKQVTLVSGTNIKTVNGASLLGSGDLVVGGGSVTFADLTDAETADLPAINVPLGSALDGKETAGAAAAAQAFAIQRANHTGTQDVATITGLGTLATQSATITDYLTIASAASTYQALDANLTSWAGVTRASGFDAFAATPSSANLAALVPDETGSGALVFGTSPTFTTNVAMPLGSVATVAINFGAVNSGFYAPDANSVAYASGGVQKFRFDSAGMTIVGVAGAAARMLSVFDGSSYPLTAGLNGPSIQAFGFGDITGGTLGRFERSTSTGLVSFQMQAASSASMTFNIGHASASFRVRAAASQTANIHEWRNSSESVLASVSAAGLGTFVGLTNTGAVSFNTGSTFSYGGGIAATHRTALGATTTGDALFIAASMAAANLALGEIRSSASADVNATTQNVWVDTGASVALTTGTWRVVAFYHGANATSSATNVRLSASANWSDTNGRRIGTITGGAVTAGPTFTTGGTSSAANFGTAGLVAGEIIAVVKMTGSGTLSMQVTNTAATGTATSYTGSHIVALKLD